MKLAFVTGGSRGHGAAVVTLLATRGWVVHELSRSGTGENHHTLNLSDPTESLQRFRQLLEDSSPDELEEILFIGNAGVLTPIAKVSAMSAEEMLNSFNVNISSALTLIQQFVNSFRSFSGKKSVVSISSGAATKGYPGWSLYCAGKAATENYMRTLSMEEELERFPFQVISFNPGVMDTVMQSEIREADPTQFPMQPRFIGLKENGDLRDPREVAQKLIAVIESNYRPGEFIYSVND